MAVKPKASARPMGISKAQFDHRNGLGDMPPTMAKKLAKKKKGAKK